MLTVAAERTFDHLQTGSIMQLRLKARQLIADRMGLYRHSDINGYGDRMSVEFVQNQLDEALKNDRLSVNK